MSLKINLPYSLHGYKLSGVYRITFDDGTFYIGGSTHLRSRASSWKSWIDGRGEGAVGGKDMGMPMLNKIKEGVTATFDIVELCHAKDVVDKEAFYLSEEKDNPLMLSSWSNGAWVPILQYKKDGLFIKKHMSISGAARYNNTKIRSIQRVLSGDRLTFKGMLFVYEHDYDKRRQQIVRERIKNSYKPRVRKKGRDVIVLSKDGVEVGRFKTIVESAKSLGTHTENVARALSGRQNTAAGHIIKYA